MTSKPITLVAMSENNTNPNGTNSAAAALQPKPAVSDVFDLLKSEPGALTLLKAGEVVEGTLLEKGSRKTLLDLGRFGTGIVYRSEMQNAREILKNLKIGDKIQAKVVDPDNEEDLVELSLAEVDKQKAWTEVSDLKEKEEIVSVVPTKFNRGGLITEISGLQAFLPISQLGNEHAPKISADSTTQLAEALEKLVGQELKVKVTDVNPRTKKLIISEKAATEVSSRELAKNYTVGQVVEGVVSGVADFGAFIRFTDNPAVEGLIHVSELDYRQIDNPKEVIHVDDAVTAKIIDIKDGKISLSLKALKADPWEKAGEKYKEGEVVHGKVYSFNPFGAIVSLDPEIQGQIHVTEFGSVEEMKKHLTLGNEYNFTVESVKVPEKRIMLKLKK